LNESATAHGRREIGKRIEGTMTVWRDLAHSLRRLRVDFVVTGVILVQLSLAIGANAAIFNLIDALLFRSLPIDKLEDLIA
jgi:hypothetical protein